jgi:carboxypeptidase Taq
VTSAYAELELHHRRVAHLSHAEAILSWDEATMMPAGGGEARAEALASLRGVIHERSTDARLGELFAAAESEAGDLDEWQSANLREMKRVWTRATALPQDLVEATSRAETRSGQAWRTLRHKNDWAGFRPLLEEVVARKREVASALGAKLGLGAYDALLDGYEPGARSADVSRLFARLREFLPAFIQRVMERQRTEVVHTPVGPFPIERQRWLGAELMKKLGFDFERGRLDVSHHPFCGGVPQDVRITTRYHTEDFSRSLMGMLHETGHAKYEQNLPARFVDQPVGTARGMAMHEGQSLLHEMQLCRGQAFLTLAAPLIAEAFPAAVARQPEAFTAENLGRLATRVRPSYIRVDADEATYPCHVIVRFEIERPLIEGSLDVKDIPDAWDAGMQAMLGLSTAGNYSDGCLQDVHWPEGLFGYFPTYTLGALVAAQLFAAARREFPDLDRHIVSGEFQALDAWLREHVWSLGSRFETNELLRRATGSPLGTAAFEAHLTARYLPDR